jgi:hypothetical protein
MHSYLLGTTALPFLVKQGHSGRSRLRLETVNRYRPTRLFSSIPAFNEVPLAYERPPKTDKQADHWLTLTTGVLNSQS